MGRGVTATAEDGPRSRSATKMIADAEARGTSPTESGMTHRWIDGALVSVAVLAIAGWLLLGVAHVDDRYNVLHVQGAWMALAQYTNEGVLYPPLYDGERYGGTRWMPIPILVNAAAANVTGEYLTSGKIVGIIATAALLALVGIIVRGARCSLPVTLALAATIVATRPGLLGGTSIGGDVLPVVLQLGALMLVTSERRRSVLASGAIAALALGSKTSGVWAALAIITWFILDRRWRDLALFVGAFTITAVSLFAIVQAVSDGRFIHNLGLLTLAGVGGGAGPIRAPNQVLYRTYRFAPAVWLLVPFAFTGVLTGGRWRRLGPYHLALMWAALLLIVTYTDVGADFNQLLDVTALTIIVAGELAGRLRDGPSGAASLRLALVAAIIWGAGSGVVLTQIPDVRATLTHTPLGYPVKPLADLLHPGDQVLSEDPYVPVSLHEDPVVLDPFMLLRLDRVNPTAVDDLITRIDDKRFDYLVMITSLDARNNYWWQQYHFGSRVVDAMRRSYVLQGRIDDYFVYRPAP
jgi:hypothetical protein